ncbi:hypothetical protein ACJ72_07372 [Emergomyces africanus]|uniref:Uncharacterized protein n=1 Tax=Emergomyces africanus TaxID=1955775 RepID=A0A1B7NNC7_9EURO|nr:hypothetical protein ACJ72_07372 [Emergomyces africanus]
MTIWKVKIAQYEKMKRAMERINNLIWKTVAVDHLRHCSNDIDVKDIIKTLEACLSPTISSLQSDVRSRYNTLCKPSKNQGLERWLDQWSLIEQDIEDAGIDGLFNPKIDFINANMTIEPGYAQAWAKDVRHKKETPVLVKLINDFRERYREIGILKSYTTNFATLNGKRPGRTNGDRTNGECVCGGRHRWAKYYYLNSFIRPDNWKEKEDRRQKIDEALKNEDLKRRVDSVITRAASENTLSTQERPLGGMLLKSQEIIPSGPEPDINLQSIQSSVQRVTMSMANQREYLQDS